MATLLGSGTRQPGTAGRGAVRRRSPESGPARVLTCESDCSARGSVGTKGPQFAWRHHVHHSGGDTSCPSLQAAAPRTLPPAQSKRVSGQAGGGGGGGKGPPLGGGARARRAR